MPSRWPTNAAQSDTDLRSSQLAGAAKARTIAAVSIQICDSVFGESLLDAVDVGHRERPQIELLLGQLYDGLTMLDGPERAEPGAAI